MPRGSLAHDATGIGVEVGGSSMGLGVLVGVQVGAGRGVRVGVLVGAGLGVSVGARASTSAASPKLGPSFLPGKSPAPSGPMVRPPSLEEQATRSRARATKATNQPVWRHLDLALPGKDDVVIASIFLATISVVNVDVYGSFV